MGEGAGGVRPNRIIGKGNLGEGEIWITCAPFEGLRRKLKIGGAQASDFILKAGRGDWI